MFIIIEIYSKSYKSLNYFVNNFFNKKSVDKLKLILLKSNLQKKKRKKILTVLKSPHVNKIAQEQFEQRIYKRQIKCFTFQGFLFLFFLKKIKIKLFSDIKIKICIIQNTNNLNNQIKSNFDVNNYCLNSKQLKFSNYLALLENYGEFVLKSKSLGSSVG